MANRLAGSASPYLQQHADNPVDWWPWGPEAFAEARRRDVPLLISVGYAACHWCHVMAHESFEDAAVAEAVNRDFVAVKVDREERPDVDAVYMTATQAMTGQGGWPMTVFATPDGQPFFAGTYYPREQFLGLVEAVRTAWRDQRDAVLRQGVAVVEAITSAHATGVTGPAGPGTLDAALVDGAARALAAGHDRVNGGFGGAPKFPPHMALLFLLRHHQRTGDPGALDVARHTAERMARGGIYDQIGGGFARYAVDATWTVPHFEKMLYDNALLLRVYTLLWRLTGDPLARRVAGETARFIATDLGGAAPGTPAPAGGRGSAGGTGLARAGFAASLDADTDGVEGLTYVWTPDQLREILGDSDGAWVADLLVVTGGGTFEHGTSVPQLPRDPDDPARWRRIRAELARHRAGRPQPARDDKRVAAWNGLAITALLEFAAVAAGEPGSTAGPDRAEPTPDQDGAAGVLARAALDAARLLAEVHLVDGRLRRVSRDGVAGPAAGVLEDHGSVAEAFCAAAQYTGDGHWLRLAGGLIDVALARFAAGPGGFFDTADDAERLVTRPADPTDNATPSGLSAMVAALTGYAALTGEQRYREAAEAALGTLAPIVANHPRYAGYALASAEALLSGPYEIAVATTEPVDVLARTARWWAPPGAVVVAGRPDAPDIPLLRDRPLVGGRPTAYVCRGFVCDRPVGDAVSLRTSLRRQGFSSDN